MVIIMKFREFVIKHLRVRNFKELCFLLIKLLIITFVFIELYEDFLFLICKIKYDQEMLPLTIIKRLILIVVFLGIYHSVKFFKRKGTLSTALWILLILSIITSAVNGSILGIFYWDGPYWGRVVDADTGKPIAGASVAGEWMFDWVIPPLPAGGEVFADARETVTGKNGYFFVSMGRAAWFWPFSRIVLDDLYVYKPGYDSHPPRMYRTWSEEDKRKWLAKLNKQYPGYRKERSKVYHSIKADKYFTPRYAGSIYINIFNVDCKFYKPCIIKLNRALSIKEQREAASISFSADNRLVGFKIKKMIEIKEKEYRHLRKLEMIQLILDENKEIQKKTATVLREYIEGDDVKYKIGDIFLESVNTDNLKSLRESEVLLEILGEEYAIIRLSNPEGDETKTILKYLDLLLLKYRSNDLSKLGRKALTEFKDRKLVIKTLTSFILNRSGEDRNRKRREAVYFLERLKDPKTTPLFIHILENAPSFYLGERKSACRYLGSIGHKNSAPLLRRMLSDSNENYTVRMNAAETLGRIGDKKSVDLLIKTMGSADENQVLRQAAIHALGSIGEKQAVIPLIEVLRDTNADHRLKAAAATSLGKIGDKRAIPVLEEAIKSIGDSKKDRFIKPAIKKALKKFKA